MKCYKNLKSLAAAFLTWFWILTAVKYHNKIIGNYENRNFNFKNVCFLSSASHELILEPVYHSAPCSGQCIDRRLGWIALVIVFVF